MRSKCPNSVVFCLSPYFFYRFRKNS